MPGHTSRVISVGLAIVIAVLFFLFHLHYMQQYLDYDQVWYLENINCALIPGGLVVFSPHHLHFEIGGKFFQQFMFDNFRQAGLSDVTFNMRLRSLVFFCLGTLFLFFVLENLTHKKTWAVLGTLLIGMSHGFLMYATKVDTAIFPATGLIMVLWLLERIESGKKFSLLRSVCMGLLFFINVMFHQYMAIVCIVTVLVLLIPPILFRRKSMLAVFTVEKNSAPAAWLLKAPLQRYFHIALMAGLGLALVIGAYFFVGKIYYNLPFEDSAAGLTGRYPYAKYSFQRWLFFYQTDGQNRWGHGFTSVNPKLAFYGFTKGMLSATGVKYLRAIEWDKGGRMAFGYNFEDFFGRSRLVFNLAAVFTLVTLAGVLLLFPVLFYRYGRVFLFCLVNFVIFTVFTVYWESAYVEFWLIPVALLFVLGFMVLNVLEEKLMPFLKSLPRFVFGVFMTIFLFAMSVHNILYAAIPYSIERHAEDVMWPEFKDTYMDYFSRSVYKYPDDPYKTVRTIGDVRLFYKDVEHGSRDRSGRK